MLRAVGKGGTFRLMEGKGKGTRSCNVLRKLVLRRRRDILGQLNPILCVPSPCTRAEYETALVAQHHGRAWQYVWRLPSSTTPERSSKPCLSRTTTAGNQLDSRSLSKRMLCGGAWDVLVNQVQRIFEAPSPKHAGTISPDISPVATALDLREPRGF